MVDVGNFHIIGIIEGGCLRLDGISLPAPEACLLPMGLTSENVAAAYGIPRDRQDSMAADSHKKVGIQWDVT